MIAGIYFRDRIGNVKTFEDKFYFISATPPYELSNSMIIQEFRFSQGVKYKQHMSKTEYYNDLIGHDSVQLIISALLVNPYIKTHDKSAHKNNYSDAALDNRTFLDVVNMIERRAFEEIGIFFDNKDYNPNIVDVSDFFREYMGFEKGTFGVAGAKMEDGHFGRIIDSSCSAVAEGGAFNLNLTASFKFERKELTE